MATELASQTPPLLLESALSESEEGESPSAQPRVGRSRLVVAALALSGMAFVGHKYYGRQSPKPVIEFQEAGVIQANCANADSFTDSHGDTCEWYASKLHCDIAERYKNDAGKTAYDACCICGGGRSNAGCTDTSGFKDSHDDGCDWYNTHERCGQSQGYVNSDGKQATDACCLCGGGGGGGNGGDNSGGGNGAENCGVKGSPGRRLSNRTAEERRLELSAQIVNGNDADVCEWTWQVGLRDRGGQRPYCGAMLIGAQWVLTASHCVEDGSTNFEIVAGKYHTARDFALTQKKRVAQVIMHPQYNKPKDLQFDIALIKMDSPMEMTSCVGTVCLPDSDVAEGSNCFITGWGAVYEDGPQPAKLQEAVVQIHPQADCIRKNGRGITDDMICAQGKNDKGVTDGCQGDSGGPLVCEVGGKFHIIGATSWGFGCAGENNPGVWSRVTSSRDWIREVTGL